MFKSTSTSLILLGILAVIVGIIAIAWPGVTILALVILFAVYAFMDAGLQAARAFNSGAAGPVVGHLLLGLIDLAAGVIALAWPAPTSRSAGAQYRYDRRGYSLTSDGGRVEVA